MPEPVRSVPAQMYANGFTDLVSVVPPKARIYSRSRLTPQSLGKCPGLPRGDGTWIGFPAFLTHPTSAQDVDCWDEAGANFGLRTASYPVVDVDCMDAKTSEAIATLAIEHLGAAPIRVGQAPKQALLYRTDYPFRRVAVTGHRGTEQMVVEILGAGRQCVVLGTHPKTERPYTWNVDPAGLRPELLTTINQQKAHAFLEAVRVVLEQEGWTCKSDKNAVATERAAIDQVTLRAPNLAALSEVVAAIHNDEHFADRSDYLKMAIAIRAASMADDTAGRDLFFEWSSRSSASPIDPEYDARTWESLTPPFELGWDSLLYYARRCGYSTAHLEFGPLGDARSNSNRVSAPGLSEQFLGDAVAGACEHRFRYVPQFGTWLAWDGARWKSDERRSVRVECGSVLRRVAQEVLKNASASGSPKEARQMARSLCTASKAANVLSLASLDQRVVVTPDELDKGNMLLNTPSGPIHLDTGTLEAPAPSDLLTKVTGVSPSSTVDCPRWLQFVEEIAGGDQELIKYLQRAAGYWATGDISEHAIFFLHGSGGNGKSVFVNTIQHVLGDYAQQADMSLFMDTRMKGHSTTLARLRGARLVVASETDARGRWDEAILKSLSGGDRIAARFLFKDEFEFSPVCKIVLLGNCKPSLTRVDYAMQRRLHMIPFTQRPKSPDLKLSETLREESAGILAWIVDGCLEWQKEGLRPPPSVVHATDEYFDEQDSIGRWLREQCELATGKVTLSSALYENYREWCGHSGEEPLIQKSLISHLKTQYGLPSLKFREQGNLRGLEGIGLLEPIAHQLPAEVAPEIGEGEK